MGQLNEPWDLFKTWGSSLPISFRCPAAPRVTYALFVAAILHATVLESAQVGAWFQVGVGILLCFHRLMRAGEFLR